jgi:hypothetical protein
MLNNYNDLILIVAVFNFFLLHFNRKYALENLLRT